MAFVKVGSEFIELKIKQLESHLEVDKASLIVWKANRVLHLMGKDIYVNRQQKSITSDLGVIPIEVKAPCRFVERKEIESLKNDAEIQVAIYTEFLSAIDNGDFLMTDDDPDEHGDAGFQLFKKENPTVNVLSC